MSMEPNMKKREKIKDDPIIEWQAFYCPKNKREYYFNPKTNIVTWILPDDDHFDGLIIEEGNNEEKMKSFREDPKVISNALKSDEHISINDIAIKIRSHQFYVKNEESSIKKGEKKSSNKNRFFWIVAASYLLAIWTIYGRSKKDNHNNDAAKATIATSQEEFVENCIYQINEAILNYENFDDYTNRENRNIDNNTCKIPREDLRCLLCYCGVVTGTKIYDTSKISDLLIYKKSYEKKPKKKEELAPITGRNDLYDSIDNKATSDINTFIDTMTKEKIESGNFVEEKEENFVEELPIKIFEPKKLAVVCIIFPQARLFSKRCRRKISQQNEEEDNDIKKESSTLPVGQGIVYKKITRRTVKILKIFHILGKFLTEIKKIIGNLF